MAWNLSGELYESCSCKMICRCSVGPAEPDQGWCSAVQFAVVETGDMDGVDLSGVRYAVAFQLPGDFMSGIEKARLYFDEETTQPPQREAIEAIYHGRAGGFWEGLQDAIAEWLPSQVTPVTLKVTGDDVEGSVVGVAELALSSVRTEGGTQARLSGAPVPAALGIESVDLATANGTHVSDPDLRAWESLGYGGHSSFSWSS